MQLQKKLRLSAVGDSQLEKGEVREGITLYAWDSIPRCTSGECPVHVSCVYEKEGKCGVLSDYLQTFYKAVLGTYRYMDETMLFKVGMQIVPIYLHLAKFQLIELSLQSPMTLDSKGNEIIHPVYKGIRDTMKTINSLWKDLGLTFEFPFKPKLKPSEEDNLPGNTGRGDPSYYANLTKDNRSMKGVVR